MYFLFLPLQQVDPFGVQRSLGVAGRAVGAFLGTLIVGALLLAITIVGLLVAVPLIFLGLLLKFAGDALVYVYVGSRAADGLDWETTRWGHLVVGAVFAGLVAAVPLVGSLVSFVVSSIGVGAIVHTLYRRYDESA